MNRKTLTALAAFAVLGLIAIVLLRQPEKGERDSDRPRPITKIDPAALDTLEITRQGVTTVLKREGTKYKITAPVAYGADDVNGKAAFEAVEKLELTGLVTEQKAKHAEFQVDDAGGVRVVGKSGKQAGKVLVDVMVGKGSGTGTMVRPAGKDDVWQANGSLRYTFDKSLADWRERSVTTFANADAEKLDVKAKDGSKITLAKKKKEAGKEGGEDVWEVAESSIKIDKLDTSMANMIVSAMASFKTNEFADNVKPAEVGLDPAAITLTVSLKGGKTSTLLIGDKKGEDDFYAKVPESPQVFLVKKYNIDRVARRPVEFRDKTLCDIATADLGELAVTNGDKSYTLAKDGTNWKASKPAKLEVDASKITPLAGALKEWKATSFADETDVKATGLAKPKVIVAKAGKSAKGGAACTVKVGDETKDKQSYYAQTAKGADIYLVPKWSVDRFLVKPDDLKKGAAPSPHGGGPNPHAAN